MIGALVMLLGLQLIGEIMVQMSGIAVPGPVVGMVLLFIILQIRNSLPEALRNTAEVLLSNLALLFIPAGVGIIQHGTRLANEWQVLLVTIIFSTLITAAITALVMYWIICWQRRVKHRDG